MTTDQITTAIHLLGKQARAAALQLATLSTETKNTILRAMADELDQASATIITENAKDLAAGEEKGLSNAMLDRLRLDEERVAAIADGIRQVATLPDPVGQILDQWTPDNGLDITQVRVPIGTIGIIYESRPNVTSDAAVLCLKSGNATILRGGSEAIHSNRAIATALQAGGEKGGLPPHSIQLIPFTDRASVQALAQMDQFLDLIIPRGGKGLIETVVSLARMPVIKHYDGICHTYLHHDADPTMGTAITVDAKTHKPGVCNALETLLVNESFAKDNLVNVAQALHDKGVELRGCQATCQLLSDSGLPVIPATEEDWHAEYLDLIISIKIVPDLDAAIAHINHYSSKHSDCIVTPDRAAAEKFQLQVDSACTFHNASTRFSDGGEFGFGAEIGISTDKIHARGPMALRELTAYQYRVNGTGQTKS